MEFYAHTAEDEQGARLPESSGKWQPLAEHLRNVAELAEKFAEPLGLSTEAKLAGLLHDLGKYADRFQARLRNPSICGINHWAAGATRAAELHAHHCAFSVDGHHTGLPARDGHGLKQTIARMRADTEREAFCKCAEPVAELLRRLHEDELRLPVMPERQPDAPFSPCIPNGKTHEANRRTASESRMREIRTSGLMRGETPSGHWPVPFIPSGSPYSTRPLSLFPEGHAFACGR